MYEQTLYKVLEDHVKPKVLKRMNRYKKWEYGYNEEHDLIVISKTGEIGEIYEIQDLVIALPKENDVVTFEDNRWPHTEYPKELSKIKSVFDWEEYPLDFKEKWYDYIDKEFTRREEGFWFINKDKPTYITGTNYMYLQWSKIDVGQPDFRESNRLFYIFWEACKADKRSYGMCYLKNRRSGFRSWQAGRPLTKQQYLQMHALVYSRNLDPMQRKCLLTKLSRYQSTIHSSSNQYKTVWTGQKQNLRTGYPRPNSQGVNSTPTKSYKKSPGLTRPSTGRTQGTTPMTGKN